MLATLIALAFAAAPSATERANIFRAAGFHRDAGRWTSTCDDPGTPSFQPGEIKPLGDLNGDGRPEALVTEGSAFCYGNAGAGFTVLTRSRRGRWTRLYQSHGIPTFLKSRANGWPEIEVGLPGRCIPILRFNGRAYAIHRREYQGKPCIR